MASEETNDPGKWRRLPDDGTGGSWQSRAAKSRPQIVYLDPHADRPVSPYSPEGEIRMMGEFAAGLSRSKGVSRPMAYALVAIVLLPIVISVLALVSTWW